MKVLLTLAVVVLVGAHALPTDVVTNMTDSGDKPCCQGKCTGAGLEKYWSIAKGILGGVHCGECCMNPKDYKLYHFFEKNLTKSAVDSPCTSFGFTKYDSTVTHGFGPVKMTLDLYDKPKPSPPPSPPGHCAAGTYCCPDAKACLFPTETSCKDNANACGKGEVCCPLTKICVLPRKPCVSPCDAGSYCCPVTKHCVAPTAPGVRCRGPKDCGSGEACCPTTKVCVKLGATCTPPVAFASPKDDVTVFKVQGAECGQTSLAAKIAPFAEKAAGLKEGTCASQGYTVADGKQTMKIPVVGTTVTIYKFKKP